MKSRTLLATVWGSAAIGLVQPWALQAADSGDDATLEEVVVTAQKRQERLIEVPMAITAVSGETLKERGIENIQDLSFAVPGLTMREDGPGSYTIYMRGLTNSYGSEALVSVYMDEIPLSLSGYDQMDVRPFDIERVEVLKGPQGTLYGQGAVAGTVRYITKAANLSEFEGSLEAQGYNVSHGDMGVTSTAVVNLPLVKDRLALRLAGQLEKGGGWIDQPEASIKDGNGQDNVDLRAKLLWAITDQFRAEATFLHHRSNIKLGLGYEQEDRTDEVAIDPSNVLIPKLFEYDISNLNLNYDLGFATLTSATTYIDHHHEYPFSYFGGPLTVYEGNLEGTSDRYQDITQFSEELRLASSGNGPFGWTIGAFYRDLDSTFTALIDTIYFGTLTTDQPYLDQNKSKSFSTFADVSYKITDKLKIGAGARWFKDDKENFDGFRVQDKKFTSFDPRIVLSYAFTEDTMVYASVAEGFRSGGFNSFGYDGAPILPTYQPESIRNHEIGTKGTFAGGKAGFEAAVFFTKYDDMLRRGLIRDPVLGLVSLTSNIGKAEIKGVEAGLTLQAAQGLTLNVSGAYLDAKVTGLATEGAPEDRVNFEGDHLDYVPKFSYSLGANYAFRVAGDIPAFFRVDFNHRDEVNYTDRSSFPAANLPQVSDALDLLNLRMGIERNNVNFELFSQNVTNLNKSIDPYRAWANANRTRPRVIGLKVGYQF